MSKKYKFVVDIPYNMEIDSEYDVDGVVIYPTYSQAEPIELQGVFNSYEEAKKAAEEFKIYNAILSINHGDWTEIIHSFDPERGETAAFFTPGCADEWVNAYVQFSEHIGYDLDFKEIEILKAQILEVEG